jgi:hypothetical protein
VVLVTPEERREAQIGAIGLGPATWSAPAYGFQALDRLLAHLDQTEPATADALRFGLAAAGEYVTNTEHLGNGLMKNSFGMKYVIDYPEGHKS